MKFECFKIKLFCNNSFAAFSVWIPTNLVSGLSNRFFPIIFQSILGGFLAHFVSDWPKVLRFFPNSHLNCHIALKHQLLNQESIDNIESGAALSATEDTPLATEFINKRPKINKLYIIRSGPEKNRQLCILGTRKSNPGLKMVSHQSNP